MKKITALLLCLTLCAALLAGCGGKTKDPDDKQNPDSQNPGGTQEPGGEQNPGNEQNPSGQDPVVDPAANLTPAEKIVNSYYSYGYDVDANMFYYAFFHFYDAIPGMGSVFYASFAFNQITFTGTYEVVEQECEYTCWPSRDDATAAPEGATPPTGKAPYTVNFYDFDGNLLDSCGFDGDKLYMDMTVISGNGGENAVYTRDTDPENSAFAEGYAGEKAAPILSLVSPDDETATLELLVNGKYNDAVIMFVAGTYSMNEDQSVITLTPDSASDNGATVTKNEDGSYTYKSTDGTEVVLAVVGAPKTALYVFKGQVPVPGVEDTMGDLVCEIYDDNTVRVYASAFGAALDVDSGTCEIDMTTYTINLHLEKAGDLATYFTETGMAIDYKAAGVEVFGDIETTLTMGGE